MLEHFLLSQTQYDLNDEFTLKVCLLGNVKIIKNVDPDKYSYAGYGTEFDSWLR